MVEVGIRVQHPWPQPMRGGGVAWDEIRASKKRTGVNTASCSHTSKSFYENNLTNIFMSPPSSVHLRLTYIYAIARSVCFVCTHRLLQGVRSTPLHMLTTFEQETEKESKKVHSRVRQ
jgi:hypothetical protein